MLLRQSLTTRLTIFFTLVVAILILGLGWLFTTATERHFADLDQLAMEDKRSLIQEIVSKSNSQDDLRWRLNEALDHHHGLYVQITNAKGETLFRNITPGTNEDMAVESKERQDGAGRIGPDGSVSLRTLYFDAIPKYTASDSLRIMVAVNAEHHRLFLDSLQRSLAIFALVAMLMSAGLAWLAARLGLAPLHSMRDRASIVSGQKLNERMPVESVPIEMADLAKELNRMLDRLQRDFRRLSDFSADLAHELRTPLTNLLTQTQVALSSNRDAKTYRDILASNAEELQILARMVSDMLFLAKTERGVDLPNRESFMASREVLALLEFYESVAEEKRIRISLHGEGRIHGDRLMFRRAVGNLLSNALRYVPERGALGVELSERPDAVEVSVHNTGPDIDESAIPYLFDRFYRADPSRVRPETDGAGLGLAITKAIVEAHQGTISVHSNNGVTRFTLSFPAVSNVPGM